MFLFVVAASTEEAPHLLIYRVGCSGMLLLLQQGKVGVRWGCVDDDGALSDEGVKIQSESKSPYVGFDP